jgi:hypothetical protein
MPRYFKRWEEGLPQLRQRLLRVDDIRDLSRKEKQSLRTTMAGRGFAPDEPNAMIMWGGSRRLLAVFDPGTLQIRALLEPDGA